MSSIINENLTLLMQRFFSNYMTSWKCLTAKWVPCSYNDEADRFIREQADAFISEFVLISFIYHSLVNVLRDAISKDCNQISMHFVSCTVTVSVLQTQLTDLWQELKVSQKKIKCIESVSILLMQLWLKQEKMRGFLS